MTIHKYFSKLVAYYTFVQSHSNVTYDIYSHPPKGVSGGPSFDISLTF